MMGLEANPLGKALAWVCGGLALLSAALMWAYSWPVSSGNTEINPEPVMVEQVDAEAISLGDISEYQVVNDRPVFNESRQPLISIEGENGEIEFVEGEVAGTPDVRLTGVVITPEQRIATLSPSNNDAAVIAHEGQPLDGDYVGWMVSKVEPRMVRLESEEGESFEVELMVHDQVIAEPPKPRPEPPEAVAQEGSGAQDQEGRNLSRAEEIRQRIAERREQLRAEANARNGGSSNGRESGQRSQYEQSIRDMIQRGEKDENDSTSTTSDDG